MELDGPVEDFDVSLPEMRSNSTLDASIIDEGMAAELVLNYADPNDAALETTTLPGVDVEIVENDEGMQSVLLTDAEGELVGGIAFEEAVTADGNPVDVLLALDGNRIAQTFMTIKSQLPSR